MLKGYQLLDPNQQTLRLQSCFIWVALITGAFILFFITSETNFVFVENFGDFQKESKELNHSSEFYTIRTSGCTIPGMTAINDDVNKFVEYPKEFNKCNKKSPLVESNSTHIWLVKNNIPHYFSDSWVTSIDCCASVFLRPDYVDDIYNIYVDDRVEFKECIEFEDAIAISEEFVKVVCTKNESIIYEDFFAFTHPKEPSDNAKTTINGTYNVLIFGIDAVSRLNFHRTMPKTIKFLKKNAVIELNGYNKVGDNTFPNLIPVLMGLEQNELKHICLPNYMDLFDNCPFIWNDFKNAGFYTGFGEDISVLGTFNYGMTGFMKTPTDYYLHTFMHQAHKYIGNNKDWNSNLCLGFRYAYQVLLKYASSMINTLKRKSFFGFFWEITMTHDHLNYPMLIDESYEKFLRNLENIGVLNKTVIILMSDHGIRWGEIRNTKQGRFEERLPFVFILLPPSFKAKYSIAYNNIKANERRLTNPYDIHETLKHLINISHLEDSVIEGKMKEAYSQKRGISLFVPIFENRTCESAGIASHWCTCHKSRSVDKTNKNAVAMANVIVDHMNNLLKAYPQCALLILNEIVDASQHEISDSAVENADNQWHDYTIVVKVTPSLGVFESTVRKDFKGNYSITGTVSRLNLYGTQSRCVDNYRMKLYCFCR